MARELPMLYLDDDLAIVAKPSGIAVHRGLDRSDDNVLVRLRRQLGQWVWPVHRLDRGTSGALVFARTAEAAREASAAFARGNCTKRYLAWCRGAPRPAEGLIDYAIPRDPEDPERVEARTAYRVLAIADDPRTAQPRYGLVLCLPETGRTHQLRRHLRHVRCPILGDTTYGDNKENRALREHADLHRLALHAFELTLPHPRSGQPIAVRAELPEDLMTPLSRLGLEPTAWSGARSW